MIVNGDGGYGLVAAYIGGLAAQAGWQAWSKGRRPPGAVAVFIAWTEWTLAVAVQLRWQHYKWSLLLLLSLLLLYYIGV